MTHPSTILARTLLHDAAVSLAAVLIHGGDLAAALALLKHRLENLAMVEDYLAQVERVEVDRVVEVIEAREVMAMPEWVQ